MEIIKHYLLLCLTALLLTACSTPPPPPLRLGTNVWPGYEPLYLAQQQNFLDNKKIHLVEFSSSSQTIQAFRNGLIDGAALTLDETLLLLETGEQLKIILVTDISSGGDVIIGRSDIASLQDIRGKRIGLEANALGAYVISRALEIAGLEKNTVELIPLDIDEQLSSFKQGKVDAVVTFEPVRSQLLKAGGKQLFDSSQIPGEIVDVLVIRKDYLEKHRDIVQHLLDGWYQALKMIKSQPYKSAEILSRRMGLNAKETLASYQGLTLPGPEKNRQLLQESQPKLLKTLNKLSSLMNKEHLLKSNVKISDLLFSKSLQHRSGQ